MSRPHWDSFEIDNKKEAKEMKKQFAKLSRAEQEKIESNYHRMKPEELDGVMSSAKPHSPNMIRLSSRLVEKLKTVAESEGEPEYQAMVQRWVKERLRQAAKRTSTPLRNRSR